MHLGCIEIEFLLNSEIFIFLLQYNNIIFIYLYIRPIFYILEHNFFIILLYRIYERK